MSEQSGGKSGELEARLIARAWKDPRFAEELRRDPRGVVERELAAMSPGAKLRPDVKITVLEETPDHFYLVVPPKPAAADALSDTDLRQLSGGCIHTDYTCGYVSPANLGPVMATCTVG